MSRFLAGLLVGVALGAAVVVWLEDPGLERPVIDVRPERHGAGEGEQSSGAGPAPPRIPAGAPVAPRELAPQPPPRVSDEDLLVALTRASRDVGSTPVRKMIERIRKRQGVRIPSEIAFRLRAQNREQAALETIPAWSDADLLSGLERVLDDPRLVAADWAWSVTRELGERNLVTEALVARLAVHALPEARWAAASLDPESLPPAFALLEKLACRDPAQSVRLAAIWNLAALSASEV